MDIGIVIGTFGNDQWEQRGNERLLSLNSQTLSPTKKIHIHSDSLANARNAGAEILNTKYIIFLDADDYLDSKYIESMTAFLKINPCGLVQPATRGFYPDGTKDEDAILIPEKNLFESNFLIIGTLCDGEIFKNVGMFDESLPVLEDWDLWIRMFLGGAKIGKCPEAIYMVGVNEDGRNSSIDIHNHCYGIIKNKYSQSHSRWNNGILQ